eukprot:TRINITY_DN11326_c0_g1_i1.p1 TRINITY_DN11326_c0_g1~~TRINITY_DN11326_c0_g1_i1.p1  ORF type:complete len:748 (+),score=178.04 TRINITY_DN11326_c0_g1_i1:7-2250(+)
MRHSLVATSTPAPKFVFTGLVYTNPNEQVTLRLGSKYVFLERVGGPQQVDGFVFCCGTHPDVAPGTIGLSQLQRKNVNASLNQAITLLPWKPTENDVLAGISFTVRLQKENGRGEKTYKASDLEEIIKKNFLNFCMTETQEWAIEVAGTTLILTVSGIQNTQISQASNRRGPPCRGLLIESTNVTLAKANESSIKILGSVNTTSTGSVLFGPNFNFEQMGIGGLDREFADIFRRAFASRVFPSEVISNLGIHHVKGILLYGPPGTGKTLIARQIGQMLNAREPKVVNGPSILNKFVGQSEENIRALFAEAEQEQREKGLESELHIIIFDELDAICKERGSTSGGTGVGDSVVNQLLSKLDGVDQLNNILVIGMTNRKDLIDEALLRPGRLEVHMEIGLPDEHGRQQIFNIHTTPMRKHNYLDDSVSVEELARHTKNFSGAEIEGVVKSAASFALSKQIDIKVIDKPDPSKIKVRMEDFLRALNEVRPAFGVTEDKLEKAMQNGIIPYSEEFNTVLESGKLLIKQVEASAKTPILSVVLSGSPGSGKSALAAHLALLSKFPFIKVLSPEDYIGYVENSRADKIHKAFKDAYKSELSVIVIDDLERFIDYAPIGPRYSNVALQALIILLKTPPPKGKKLLVIATTSQADMLERLGLLYSVDCVLDVPSIDTGVSACSVLKQLQVPCTKEDFNRINSSWQGSMGIKKFITLVEMVAQAVDPMSGESFGDKFVAMKSIGILRSEPRRSGNL